MPHHASEKFLKHFQHPLTDFSGEADPKQRAVRPGDEFTTLSGSALAWRERVASLDEEAADSDAT